jgi:predicted site-specific integrase-resolvase
MNIEDDISYTMAEAANLLNVSISQLHAYIKSHKIEVRKTDYAERIRGKELKRFIDSNIQETSKE